MYGTPLVTLHVSVWVEILIFLCYLKIWLVTLHVSVWVEMCIYVCVQIFVLCHAPRERVSWNICVVYMCFCQNRHAPRERVSWNVIIISYNFYWYCHAPRERVSWNAFAGLWSLQNSQSRSTWACELKFNPTIYIPHIGKVTLHVSVWVEISNLLDQVMPKMSRSTWACELKSKLAKESDFNICHAPRERVSWNYRKSDNRTFGQGHAPRERVSWNRF